MVVYHQGGGGCDYTIGCGKRVTKFYASSMDEAKELVLEEDALPIGLEDLEDISIYEIADSMSIDLEEEIAKEKAKELEREREQLTRQELKELEVLAKKYGKKLSDR